ncbi:MAG: NUDIX hydrolase [Haloechinothrix sp.]
MIDRRAARVLLVAGRSVLLLQGIDPARPERSSWWMTPGGGIDDGETMEYAATREVFEETGLRLAPEQLGPVVATRVAEFDFDGRRFHQSESFFVVQVALFTPQSLDLRDHECRMLLGHRWWSLADLENTRERVYPRELPDMLRAVLAGSITRPMSLSFDTDDPADEPGGGMT